jgi:xanthine/CO dehydrogenase XdhC/CoxF family maturation factor
MPLNDARTLQRTLAEALATGAPLALATVVRTEGSAYRKAGARMLVTADGATLGLISGGCLEGDIAERAVAALASGRPELMHFDLTREEEAVLGWGKGCMGRLWILVEPFTARLEGARARLVLETEALPETAALAIAYATEAQAQRLQGGTGASTTNTAVTVGDRVRLTASGELHASADLPPALLAAVRAKLEATLLRGRPDVLDAHGISWCFHRTRPPQDLVVFGAGVDAVPLARIAAQLGWRVRLFDHRPRFARPDRFPEEVAVHGYDPDALGDEPRIDGDTAVVVMTHNLLVDARILAWAASRAELPAYVGLLGPEKRRERLVALAREAGVDPIARLGRRLYGPVGLDLGGETEHDIALSVVAQLQQLRHGASAAHKRDAAAAVAPPLASSDDCPQVGDAALSGAAASQADFISDSAFP